jgi:CubicO group peptidase (beta-lactamase class C family)
MNMSIPEATGYWTERLHEFAIDAHVHGATLGIWVDGTEILTAHGVVSAATQVSTTVDTLFQIGSITKVWTATMIMQLVEEGRLSLDMSVSEVLPGQRIGTNDVSYAVTVRHLLTHTSGLDGDIFTDTGRGDDCVEVYVDRLASAPQIFDPGAAYSYCNTGFVILGRIIEVLDRRMWDASLRHRLIEPLGLAETVTLAEEAILHRAAVGHRERPHETVPVASWCLSRSIGPAGLIKASARDVLTFARLHLDGGVGRDGTRLLSQSSVIAMQQPQRDIPTIDDRGDAVGLTWWLQDWDGHRVFGHHGSTMGQQAYLRIDGESQLAVCLLTNAADSEALYQPLVAEVFQEYAGVMMPTTTRPTPGPINVDLARHAGRYERTSERFDATIRDGQLHLLVTPTGELGRLDEEGPQELVLYPVDATGDNFVWRLHDDEPWTPCQFGRLDDGTPYVYVGYRITPSTNWTRDANGSPPR